MNLLNTLIPSFIPDVSNAKRVTFKSQEDLKDDEIRRQEKDEIKKLRLQTNVYQRKLNHWRKDVEKVRKQVTRCEFFLKAAQQRLKETEDAKPAYPMAGN